jgi:hypothetical protein
MNSVFNRKIGTTIFRIIMGFLILKDFIIYFFNRQFLFSNKGIISYETYLDIVEYYHLNWLYVDFNREINVFLFCALGILFSTTFILGIFTRISSIVLFFLLLIFKIRDIYLLDGADNVISVILPFFMFLDSYSFSVFYEEKTRPIKNKFQPYLIITSNWFSTAMMLQICIIYFFASLHKLQGTVWVDGTALYYILNSDDFSASSLNAIITSSIILVKFFTWFSIAFQLSFPFLVLLKKTKYLVLLLGVLFHIGIFILMRIDNFSLIMLACYTIFLTDNEYLNILHKLKPIKK